MYVPLGVKTDYSLLKSLIKIPELMTFLNKHNISTIGILDDNLFGTMCFYEECNKNNIKPIVGLKILLNDNPIYLYAQNEKGFKNLIKINTIKQQQESNVIDLKKHKDNIICVIPYKSIKLYEELNKIYEITYLSYLNAYEKNNALVLSKKIVYLNEISSYEATSLKYLEILNEIDSGNTNYKVDENAFFNFEISKEDEQTTEEFSNLIELKFITNQKYIPHFDDSITDSYNYLSNLCKKGLEKRLNNNITEEYKQRLLKELNTINKMGFVDYFLIVYDYVKYAKKNNILVGPGRGSAAGSLVSYCLGITSIDPLQYNLLFERFLNPERVTMPDIDIDFEFNKRDQVIEYVKDRYGHDKVANIITYGTLGSRQAIRDVGKILKVDTFKIDRLSNLVDPKTSLKDNLNNKYVKDILENNKELKKVYQTSMQIEGLKRHTSVHAAGVIISSVPLDDIIPMYQSGSDLLTGYTFEYLENMGLLKMDFLALKNLTIIQNVLDLIEKETNVKINLNEIPLDDKDAFEIFKNIDTEGIFQFESSGMKNLISKLKPSSFSDLVACVALFRPGPMENIDTFIKRKNGIEKIVYPDPSLEPILKDTYGIMIYQEQIMQVLVKMANYSFAEADNIRRAMSKKKIEVMNKEREVFINKSISNGYTKEKASEVYDIIIKFANYGFNKAHSVSYALIGYQMAYLKAKYPIYFLANLLNMSIGSDVKTKEYIDEAKHKNIKVFKPNINVSTDNYLIKDNALLLPLNAIHNIGSNTVIDIINERTKNGKYIDFFDFIRRTYGKTINKKIIESLIDADTFRSFNYNHKTLSLNIDSAIDYALLCGDLDESLVIKPSLVESDEYSEQELITRELDTFGYYVTNHPASKYTKGIMKLKDIKNFFDKYVTTVVIISNIHKIKTKKGEDMAFITANDETDSGEFIIFPKNNKYIYELKKDELVMIKGQVNRRNDKYSIVISNIEKI